jgi:hypothetical protein
MSLWLERIESGIRLVYTRARSLTTSEAIVSDTEQQSKHWSDEKTDVVAILTIFVALVLGVVHFISNQV